MGKIGRNYYQSIENRLIARILNEIEKKCGKNFDHNMVRARILGFLSKEEYLYSDFRATNNLVTPEYLNINGISINLTAEVGMALSEYFHMILVQFRMLLHSSHLQFQHKDISFEEPEHLFGLSADPLPSSLLSLALARESSRTDSVFHLCAAMRIDEKSFYDSRTKIGDIMRLLVDSPTSPFKVMLNDCVSDTETKDDFINEWFPLFLDEVSAFYHLTSEQKKLLHRYFIVKLDQYHSLEWPGNFIESIFQDSFDILHREHNLLYLEKQDDIDEDIDQHGFLYDLCHLLVFLKCSHRDESFYDEIVMACQNGQKKVFHDAVFDFYQKYSMYFSVDSFSREEVTSVSKQLFDLVGQSIQLDPPATMDHTDLPSVLKIPDISSGHEATVLSDLFNHLSHYTKSIFYHDYVLHNLVISTHPSSIDDVYLFDLLLNQGFNIQYHDSYGQSMYPNYAKIYNKLNDLNMLLHIVSEHFLPRQVIFSYDLADVPVQHSRRTARRMVDIKFENSPLVLALEEYDDCYRAVSIQYRRAFEKNSKTNQNVISGVK